MDDPKETGRIEAFSDGVFAVAITLLVLNIQVPDPLPPDTGLIGFLFRHQWPYYLAFLTSFATIGIMWINHHRLFTHIKRSDNVMMVLNLLLLLIIVFIPFPTALLAQYILDPFEHQAAAFYSATFVLMALCFNLLWRYAAHDNRLLAKDTDQHAVKAISNQYMFGPLFYLVTFGVAWISGPVSIALNLLLALFFALPGRKPREVRERES
ncbi:MAG: TMEM175 family protein [Ktedonobacteraceae bacterium]